MIEQKQSRAVHQPRCVSRKLTWKEKLLCTVTTMLCHLQFGSLIHYPLDFRTRIFYPNFGSTLFVLMTQMALQRMTLHPKDLCFNNYFFWLIYTMGISYLLTNIALVLVYQVIVGTLLRVVFWVHDTSKILGFPFYDMFNTHMVCLFSHGLFAAVFLWLLINWNPCKRCQDSASRKRDTRPYEARRGYLL